MVGRSVAGPRFLPHSSALSGLKRCEVGRDDAHLYFGGSWDKTSASELRHKVL